MLPISKSPCWNASLSKLLLLVQRLFRYSANTSLLKLGIFFQHLNSFLKVISMTRFCVRVLEDGTRILGIRFCNNTLRFAQVVT